MLTDNRQKELRSKRTLNEVEMFEILEHYMELTNPHTESSAYVAHNDEMLERLYRLVRGGGADDDVRALNEFHPDWSRAFNDSEEMMISFPGAGGGKKSRRKRTKNSRTTGGKKSRKQRKRTTLKGGKRKRRRTRRRR
jgi:hypothetical protein